MYDVPPSSIYLQPADITLMQQKRSARKAAGIPARPLAGERPLPTPLARGFGGSWYARQESNL